MSGIFNNIQQFLLNLVNQIQRLSPFIGLAVVVIAGLIYTFGDDQMAQGAKKYGKQVVIGLACVWLGSIIINTLISLFGANITPLSP